MGDQADDLRLLTLQETSLILQVSKRTLHRMIKQKKLPAFKLGGQWRISQATLREWLRNHEPGEGAV